MPIYSNVPICVRRWRDYKSGGYYFRRSRPKENGSLHVEAPLYVGTGVALKVGSVDFDGNKVYDDFSIIVTDIAGPTLSVKPSETSSGNYGSIHMILYTISPFANTRLRTDAVLVRKTDVNSVEVLSGGGYGRNTRNYDNIILRAKCRYKRVVAIQRNKNREKLHENDTLFIVTKDGVERIILTEDNISEVLSEHKLSPQISDWQYI